MSVLLKSFLILSFRARALPVFPSILTPKSLPRNRRTRTLSSVSASTFQSPPPSVSPETPTPIPPLSDSLRWVSCTAYCGDLSNQDVDFIKFWVLFFFFICSDLVMKRKRKREYTLFVQRGILGFVLFFLRIWSKNLELHFAGNYKSNGFLKVSCNGGLNQMRAAICDMVIVARLLNLTLVVPKLDKTSFWADPSDFGDIFDVSHFIDSLMDEVRIIKRLPKKFNRKYGFQAFQMSPVSWSNEKYYLEQVCIPLVERERDNV
ncbi:hypothetical protein V6Z11_A04G034100 [Gossypium hirsutum]